MQLNTCPQRILISLKNAAQTMHINKCNMKLSRQKKRIDLRDSLVGHVNTSGSLQYKASILLEGVLNFHSCKKCK